MAMRALIRPPHAGATQNDPIGFPCDRFRVAAFARRSCARHPGMVKNPRLTTLCENGARRSSSPPAIAADSAHYIKTGPGVPPYVTQNLRQ